jgi:hypothetical protein
MGLPLLLGLVGAVHIRHTQGVAILHVHVHDTCPAHQNNTGHHTLTALGVWCCERIVVLFAHVFRPPCIPTVPHPLYDPSAPAACDCSALSAGTWKRMLVRWLCS